MKVLYSSQTLKVPYSAVITSEPFDVLTQLLGNRQVQDRYSLSWKFIDTCNLEPKEVHVVVAPLSLSLSQFGINEVE